MGRKQKIHTTSNIKNLHKYNDYTGQNIINKYQLLLVGNTIEFFHFIAITSD